MTEYNLQAEPGIINISPFAFHLYAEQYLAAAKGVPPHEGFSPVPYNLYGIAIELALKAFLLAKGMTTKELEKKNTLGHNLEALLNCSEERGLREYIDVSAEVRSHFLLINDYYWKRHLVYFDLPRALKGSSDLPSLPILDRFLSNLLNSTKSLCSP
jgi:hypothetical protein